MTTSWFKSLRLRLGRKGRRGYSGARPDVVRMIVHELALVLDVGCGAGLTAKLIRDRYPNAHVFGIEADPKLARQACEHSTSVFEGPLNDEGIRSQIKDSGPYDLIICADVLEHMLDPAEALNQLTRVMADDGYLITSLPNVRHISTFWNLGIRGGRPQNAHAKLQISVMHSSLISL